MPYTKIKEKNRIFNMLKIVPCQWLLYIGFVLFNIIIAMRFSAPFAYPDEYSVISTGNWMLGETVWSYKSGNYYGYTFAPFVGIMLKLFDDIRYIYVGSLFIKALQISLVPLFCYKLLHEALEVKDKLTKVLIAVTIGMYPSFTVYSKYLSNDTTLHFTLFICFYLIGICAVYRQKDMIGKNSNADSVSPSPVSTRRNTRFNIYSSMLGFLCAFSYASHGMGLAFIVAIIFTIFAWHIVMKRTLVNYPFFFGVFAASCFLDGKIKAVVKAAVFSLSQNGLRNTFEYSFDRMITALSEPVGLMYFVKIFLSRLHYLTSATFGLFPLVSIILLVFAFRYVKARFFQKNALDSLSSGKAVPAVDYQDKVVFILTVFSFAIILCGLTLSTLNNVQPIQSRQGTFYFYGRYYEYMAMPLIIMGMYFILCNGITKKTMLIYSGVSGICYLLLSIIVQLKVIPHVIDSPIVESTTANIFFILGVLPFIGNGSNSELLNYNLLSLGLICVIVFIIMLSMLLRKKKQYLALVVLGAMFLYAACFDVSNTALSLSSTNYNKFYSYLDKLTHAVGQFDDVYEKYPTLYVVTDKLGNASMYINGRAQIAFNKYDVTGAMGSTTFDELKKPLNAIIVSDKDQKLEEKNQQYQKVYESPDAYVWIRGEDIKEYYNSKYAPASR